MEMSDQISKSFKPVPPLEELARKCEPQVDHIESGALKPEQMKAYEENEENTTKYLGLGARVKSRPNKDRVRKPGTILNGPSPYSSSKKKMRQSKKKKIQ